MMVRSLVDEVVRRRLWPIPILALLIAIAAPLLFMKSAPEGVANELPPTPKSHALPHKAKIFLSGNDSAVVSTKPSHRKAKDPFEPPALSAKGDSAAASAASTGAQTGAAQAVPVVIKNSDGSTSTATISPSTGSASKPSTSTSTKTTTPKVTTKKTSPTATSSSAAATKRVAYVDARFGERMGTMIRYRIPRLQTFRAGGNVAAIFVKYSATRNAAVFAIAPSTQVSGVTCRKVKGVCRYVDLPQGAHARLTLRGEDGSPVSRRLDVVSIRHLPKAAASKASARKTSLSAAMCLVKRLLELSAVAPSIPADSCD